MTQFQFELICKIIENGAPVLANELCGALNAFIQEYTKVAEENKQLKAHTTEHACIHANCKCEEKKTEKKS